MIVVVGAGIAGLSLAYEICRRSATVTVLESDTIASGASGVATSYLEPRLGNTAMRAIEREAMLRWPNYAEHLENISGLSVGFRREGQLEIALQDDLKKFHKDLKARAEQNEPFELLTPQSAQKLEPEISGNIASAAFLPNVRWVTGKKICQALAMAVENAGGQIKQGVAVTALEQTGGRVVLSTNDGSIIDVEKLVLCTGMGAATISGLPADIPQSRAVRGVNLIVDQSPLTSPLTHLIKHHRGNLCPRENSQLIVGTTYEAGETSLDPGPEIVEFLYQNAAPIVPKIRDLPLLKVTAGLRSKVGDGNLRLGRSAIAPQIYYSLSHGGAGFLRAPVIADELAEFVLDGKLGTLTRHHTHN
ncbi:MAG: FAD-dependent oxidoreductase [Rhizobiaceae bacterium]|nr:FAD-dependent oxidoreductase [Rhizobiaceae bacterium]